MLFQSKGTLVPIKVNSDLSEKQFHAVALSSGVATCSHTKADPVLGILQDAVKGTSTDVKTASVQIDGITRAEIGGTVAENAYLIADTDGQLISDDAADQFVVGMALESGVAGDIIAVDLTCKGPTTTA